MNTNNKFAGCIGLLTIFIATIIIGSIMNGWALTMLWGWFIVPVFDLPILSLAQAIGVGLVVTFLTKHSITTEKDKDISTVIGEGLASVMLLPIFTVGVGYIVSLFL